MMAVTTALALMVTVSALAQGATPTTKRVSVRSNGTQGNSDSFPAAISGTGRFVAFYSDASNLVAGDTNDAPDVFVHDRETKETKRVSVGSNGARGDAHNNPAISGNGRFVAFISDLAAGGTDETSGLFVHDRETNETKSVGVGGNPAISGNGRFVAFVSTMHLVKGNTTNDIYQIFVHDRETKETKRVSVSSNGALGDDDSNIPAISGNGRFVAFDSEATNLVAGDTNDTSDVFVHDRETKETKRVSVRSNGTQADRHSADPAISGNGRFVAFISGTNLVAGDTNDVYDIFVHDRMTNKTKRVSVRSNGTQGNGDSLNPAISGNGRFVAFRSGATNLVAGDTNDTFDVFVHDRETKDTKRVSVGSNGTQGDDDSNFPAISGSGRFVAFVSGATNLVAGDTNDLYDVFVRGPLN